MTKLSGMLKLLLGLVLVLISPLILTIETLRIIIQLWIKPEAIPGADGMRKVKEYEQQKLKQWSGREEE